MPNRIPNIKPCPHCGRNVYIALDLQRSPIDPVDVNGVPESDRREGLDDESIQRAVHNALGDSDPVAIAREMLEAPGAPLFESEAAKDHAVEVLAAKLATEQKHEPSTENPAWPEGVGFERPGPV